MADHEWEARLPAIEARCRERWALVGLRPLTGGYLARVFACEDGSGRKLVLKLSPPIASPHLEAAALHHWNGEGCVRIFDFDAEVGAMLLDRISPGHSLAGVDEHAAISAVSNILARIHPNPAPVGSAFPSMLEAVDWWERRVLVDAEERTAGMALLPHALVAARELARRGTARTLLHGDFLAKNIINSALKGWIAIDPLPCIGDRESDIGFFAACWPGAAGILERARQLARMLRYDEQLASRWAAIWAVGEACETWRPDSAVLQAVVASLAYRRLLDG